MMLRFAAAGVLMEAWLAGGAAAPAPRAEPQLVSLSRIWDRAPHNAFTDLLRWRGSWYCVFREAEGHEEGDGRICVLRSADGAAWESAALLEEEGVDLRDPKLSVTPDDRLMLLVAGWAYAGSPRTLREVRTRVAFSADGKGWSAFRRVLAEGDWLWQVAWHEGRTYGVSYNALAPSTPEAREAERSPGPLSSEPAAWKLKLVSSADGVNYEIVTYLGVPGQPNEATVRFLPDGEMIALVRREAGNQRGWIGTSRPPYRDWSWHETAHRLGGPNFIRLPDGTLWAASRSYPGGPKTVLARMGRTLYEPVLTLPSGGDTSYAGLVWNDGLLWVSYYSSHEGKSAIYLAKVRLR